MNLNQVTLPCTNIERSLVFYETLGLKLIVKSLPEYVRFECPVGDSTFSLHRVGEVQVKEGAWIYFEISDLDNEIKKLIKKGIAFEELPTEKSWLWREAVLKDPDGHHIILYFAGNNRKHPPWRIE